MEQRWAGSGVFSAAVWAEGLSSHLRRAFLTLLPASMEWELLLFIPTPRDSSCPKSSLFPLSDPACVCSHVFTHSHTLPDVWKLRDTSNACPGRETCCEVWEGLKTHGHFSFTKGWWCLTEDEFPRANVSLPSRPLACLAEPAGLLAPCVLTPKTTLCPFYLSLSLKSGEDSREGGKCLALHTLLNVFVSQPSDKDGDGAEASSSGAKQWHLWEQPCVWQIPSQNHPSMRRYRRETFLCQTKADSPERTQSYFILKPTYWGEPQ